VAVGAGVSDGAALAVAVAVTTVETCAGLAATAWLASLAGCPPVVKDCAPGGENTQDARHTITTTSARITLLLQINLSFTFIFLPFSRFFFVFSVPLW
jgi:hypothetical protein